MQRRSIAGQVPSSQTNSRRIRMTSTAGFRTPIGMGQCHRLGRRTSQMGTGRSSSPGTKRVSKHAVQRPRYLRKIERLDEQTCVAELPAVGAAHEAPQLSFDSLASPGRLFLEGTEGSEVALRVEDGFDRGGAESADQLVLQIFDADVEAQPFHIEAGEMRAEPGPLEAAPEHDLLTCVTETGQPRTRPLRAEASQEAPNRLRAPDRHDRDSLIVEIATAAGSEGRERDLVADSFDEHDRTRVGHPLERAARRLRASAGYGCGPHTAPRGLLISIGQATHTGAVSGVRDRPAYDKR